MESWEGAIQTVSPRTIDILKGTKPWVRFLAIVGFVVVGLMLLAAMLMLVAAPFMDEGPVLGVFMSFFYVVMAIVYAFPCLILLRYAASIRRLLEGGGQPAMEEALEHQRRFWRFAGIVTIAMLCLYALGLLAALAVLAFVGIGG